MNAKRPYNDERPAGQPKASNRFAITASGATWRTSERICRPLRPQTGRRVVALWDPPRPAEYLSGRPPGPLRRAASRCPVRRSARSWPAVVPDRSRTMNSFGGPRRAVTSVRLLRRRDWSARWWRATYTWPSKVRARSSSLCSSSRIRSRSCAFSSWRSRAAYRSSIILSWASMALPFLMRSMTSLTLKLGRIAM